jgi:hypothetical protein
VNVLDPTLELDLLSVRKIPVKEKGYLPKPLALPDEEDPDVRPLLEEMRSIVLKDRDLHDKATKAFVSFVRAYSKHEASYVFRIKSLDLVGVAKAYGLLKLPKMPELKGKPEGWTDAEVDVSAPVFIFSTLKLDGIVEGICLRRQTSREEAIGRAFLDKYGQCGS